MIDKGLVQFDTRPETMATIRMIVDRFQQLTWLLQPDELTTLTMDLSAAKADDSKLDLDRLLSSDDCDFAHDVGGIMRHMDRGTGTLTGCFLPRCARY